MEKVIQKGKPFRIHKCRRCKTKYVYEYVYKSMVYCPVCKDYMDLHVFDKKITEEQYNKLKKITIKGHFSKICDIIKIQRRCNDGNNGSIKKY